MTVQNTVEKGLSRVQIPSAEWDHFLKFFNRIHHRELVWLETHDKQTDETVVSRSQPLLSVELDLEDEKHPRINISLESDNKVIRHIFYMPSKLQVYSTSDGIAVGLHLESVNTSTTLYLRAD